MSAQERQQQFENTIAGLPVTRADARIAKNFGFSNSARVIQGGIFACTNNLEAHSRGYVQKTTEGIKQFIFLCVLTFPPQDEVYFAIVVSDEAQKVNDGLAKLYLARKADLEASGATGKINNNVKFYVVEGGDLYFHNNDFLDSITEAREEGRLDADCLARIDAVYFSIWPPTARASPSLPARKFVEYLGSLIGREKVHELRAFPEIVSVGEVDEQLDMLGQRTGVEQETPDGTERIAEPFDPDDIDVVTKSTTVELLLSRTASDMIDLHPDFQRRWGIWDVRRQSRLIESLLLRIPLPVLYAAEDDDERWEIVDGVQRLSTIARFIRPEIINEKPLVLSGLEYLLDYEGKNFDGLSTRLQMRLRETELVIHLIRKGTPPEVKFNIFARINTGGVALSPQELRHAITPGKARELLEVWASDPAFIEATDESVRPSRMDDRELVLRFIAFYLLGLDSYRQPEMDGFLTRAMKAINEMGDARLAKARQRFVQSMVTARAIFGTDAFRKRFQSDAPRLPINKAVFEALSVNLARLQDEQLARLTAHGEQTRAAFIELCLDRSFESAISQGTGDIAKVHRRFNAIQQMLAQVIGDA